MLFGIVVVPMAETVDARRCMPSIVRLDGNASLHALGDFDLFSTLDAQDA
jgi:hypothetical protein